MRKGFEELGLRLQNTAEERVLKNALSRVLKKTNYYPLRTSSAKVYHNGSVVFEELLDELAKAKHYVHIQYYLFEDGILMDRLVNICKTIVERGVEVRILYDAIGSYYLKKSTKDEFIKNGIQINPLLPLKWGNLLYTLNFRNHRKLVVIDGEIAFTGGMNLSDKYIKNIEDLGVWKDTHLKITGSVVNDYQFTFAKDYYFATSDDSLFSDKYFSNQTSNSDDQGVDTQVILGDPEDDHPIVLQQYLTMVNTAEERIHISNPYVIPNTPLLEAFRNASLRGVKITLLLPKKSDSWIVKYCMYAFFEELLSWGIEIYLYDKTFIHRKVITIDRKMASIGSGNFDHRSFEHNFELNTLFYDAAITKEVDQVFESDCRESVKLNLKDYKNRSKARRLKEGFALFFSPLL